MSEKKAPANCRLGTVGGQAVMEGVMMQSSDSVAIAVRNSSGEIVVRSHPRKSLRDRYKICRVPVIRGIVNFVEMLIQSFSTLTASAEMSGLEEEGEPTKFEKWLDKHFGKSILSVASVIGSVLGVALALFLFTYLPTKVVSLFGDNLGWFRNLIEGVLKICIFVCYMVLVSLIPDIKRVFMYHGAEHKSIFCYESGEELTVANVKKQIRFHPRCGTSFIFVILFLSILVGSVISWDVLWLRILLKVLTIPLVVGIGYEYIRYAGRHDNIITRICSAPGLWMQRITTKEPDDSMMEVAIVSIKSALHKEFPDFVIPREHAKPESDAELPTDIAQPEAAPSATAGETEEKQA